jgi:hypothetical protein
MWFTKTRSKTLLPSMCLVLSQTENWPSNASLLSGWTGLQKNTGSQIKAQSVKVKPILAVEIPQSSQRIEGTCRAKMVLLTVILTTEIRCHHLTAMKVYCRQLYLKINKKMFKTRTELTIPTMKCLLHLKWTWIKRTRLTWTTMTNL